MSIEELINKIDREQLAPRISRKVYTYDAETALKYVQAVGARVCANFSVDGENRGVYMALTAWLMGNPFQAIDPISKKKISGDVTKGIFLYGGTGSGKTIAMDVMRILCDVDKVACWYGRKAGELRWTKVRADEIAREYVRTGSVAIWLDVPSLLIDDLGTEPEEVLYMGTRADAVRMVLEARGDRKDQLTLITSNLPLGEVTQDGKKVNPIRKRYGDRVLSRLVGMCNYLYLGGCDRRMAK